MIKAARFYTEQGLSVIPTDNTKRAILPWKEFQSHIITDEQIKIQFNHPKCSGIAVICGGVSGGLEVIDIDTKYDVSGNLWENYSREIASLLPKLYVVKTKSGGYHLYYRCEVIEGNQKLANRPATEAELKDNPNEKVKVLIEIRGEGGYVIAPPTPGYERQAEFNIPVISTDERDMLLSAARSFNEVIEEDRPQVSHSAGGYQKTPWDDYNSRADIITLLEKHGWIVVEKKGPRILLRRPGQTNSYSSGDYHTELNLFKVFSTSTVFDINKGYKPFAVYAILEHNKDFSAAAKQLIRDGFGEVGITGKYSGKILQSLGAGKSKEEISRTLISEDGLSEKDAARIIEEVEDINGPEILAFWEVRITKTKKTITILRHKLVEFLYNNGFHLFFYDKNSSNYRIVQQADGLVQDASFETIKKFIKEYILSLPDRFDAITPDELLEVIMKGADTYFGKGLIEFIDAKEIDILRDTCDAAYFTFTNGIVKVSAEKIELLTYGQVGKPVWKSQVIDFKVDVDIEFDPNLCEFYDFIRKVSNGDDQSQENDTYLTSLIGYLLHRYKDPSRPYAVIFAEETEDENKGGGTGKGICVKALSYMANTERIDGKNFKLDKSFPFQRVGLDTKIIAIEDVRKNVDFEGYYSMITEGITVEKKNKDEFFIPYKDSAKVLFTTNYSIFGKGVHGKRRQKIFEFINYFSEKRTPIQEYGHRLFDDWDQDEWNRFYNLMFLCVADYLQKGIKTVQNSTKLNRKHIRLNYLPEFLEWWDGYTENGSADFKPFRDIYTAFLVQNSFDKKDYSQRRFRAAIDECCERFEYQLFKRKQGHEKLLEYKIDPQRPAVKSAN